MIVNAEPEWLLNFLTAYFALKSSRSSMAKVDTVGMRNRRILALAFSLACLCGIVTWLVLHPYDPGFHGKPETEWIKGITYFGDEAQIKQWRSFGPEGLHLLARSLDRGRAYRSAYRRLMPRLPGLLNHLSRWLPKPADSHSARMCVISLLRQFGKDAKPVEPAIARALDDDDAGVRQSALGCYGELLEAMGAQEKAARLPQFIRAIQDNDWGIRNNAVIALQFYRDQAPVVVPVLVNSLKDPVVQVRLMAAKALAKVDLQAAVRAGVVPIAINILQDTNDQVAYQAAELLGELGQEPSLAVPALIASVQGTNGLVATTAARALGYFPGQADVIVPVLLKALENTNGVVSRWGPATALKAIDPAAAMKAGTN